MSLTDPAALNASVLSLARLFALRIAAVNTALFGDARGSNADVRVCSEICKRWIDVLLLRIVGFILDISFRQSSLDLTI
jgi:hypothetical protein